MTMRNKTLLNSFALSLLFAGTVSTAYNQTGPGGVKSASEVKIWLDAGDITGASNGSPFSIWPDQSGNGNDFIQGVSQYQPKYMTSGINGKPHADFYGDYMDSPAIPSFDTQTMTWLFVGAFNNQSTVYEIAINHNYSTNILEYEYFTGLIPNSNIVRWNCNALGFKTIDAASTTNDRIYLGIRDGANMSAYEDNNLVGTRSDLNLSATPTDHNYCRIGMRAGSNITWPFKGDMYEVIVMNDALNMAEVNIVNNYLAAKYGRTISNDFYDYQASYGENVIGIGQESDGNNTVATGRGIVTISGATSLDDGDYLFLGDDDVDLGNISSNVPASLVGHERFERIWRVDEEGDIGDVTITLDLNIYAPGPNVASTRLLVNSLANGSDMSLATPISGTYDGGTNTISFTYTPTPGDYISFSAEDQDIFSITTGPWSNTSTWSCACIPTANDSVTIRTGDDVTVDGQTRAARTVLVQTGGSFDVINGGVFGITGDFVANGDFDVTGGAIAFSSTVDQTLSLSQDADVFALVASSANTLTITGGTNFTINGTLDINCNIDNSNTNLIINSTASGDGRIGANTGFTFTDDITIRRHLPAGDAEYREVTPLTFNFQFQQWDDEMVISGSGFPDGCATIDGACFYSIKSYNGTDWVDITSLTTNYGGFKGYRMYVGDDLVNWSGGTLESTGSIKTGPIIGIGFDEWNFFGNSYPSAIDFELLKAASTNMDYYFYIYNPNEASYEWYDAGATGVLDQYVAMGQGFWVKSSNGSPVVFSLNESHKTDQTATFKRPDQLSGLIMKISSPRSPYSSKVAFNTSDISTVFDDPKDMEYLPTFENAAPHLSVVNEYGKEIMVNYFNTNDHEANFSMIAEVPEPGYYNIDVTNLRNLDQYSCIHLIDIKTNEIVDLRKEGSYTFFADELKTESPRFIVSFANNGCEEVSNESTLSLLDESNTEDNIDVKTIFGNVQVNFDFAETKNVDINVTNSLGQMIYSVQSVNFAKGTHTFNVNATGVIFVNCIYDDKVVTKKVFIGK